MFVNIFNMFYSIYNGSARLDKDYINVLSTNFYTILKTWKETKQTVVFY
jgi:hypothetical protein